MSRFFRRVVILAIAVGVLATSFAAVDVAAPKPAFANGPYATQPPFWVATSAGDVWAFSGAADHGSLRGLPLNQPIVGMAPTPSNNGYWLVASDGGIFTFGDARFLGSTGHIRLNQPIVGMAATPTGNGYWLVARDGGIFTFGDARFFGSTGNIRLNQPIVGMAATPSNKGYWLVARDGGIFTFGDARFFGSTGDIRLVRPIVGMAPTPSNKGYWLVASDGGIFTFGDAGFHGSAGGSTDASYTKVVSAPDGKGYWLIRNGGDTVPFGSAATSGARRPPVGLLYVTDRPGDAAASWAMAQMGKPYIWGGNGPVGFDCSGLTSQAWKAAGVGLPRVANDQYDIGRKIPLDQLRPGDLLFWGPDRTNSRSIDHVGMYVGGGWAINSGGPSPSKTQVRSVPRTSGWMFPYAVRPVG